MLRLPSQTLETTSPVLQSPLPRLGQISFINCLPVVVPIKSNQVTINAEMVLGSPAVLNQAYELGELDLGAMSSFFYLERNDLQLIPTLSISAYGDVGSVLFFSKEKLEDLNDCLISVPAASATSINLLKVLLLEEFGAKARLVIEDQPNLDDESTTAALVIGDYALAKDEAWSAKYYRYDLGGWFKRLYDLPMVFGLWAAKNSFVEENPLQFATIALALQKAKDLGLSACFAQVLEEAQAKTGQPVARLQHYFLNELNFAFTSKHQQGLNLYAELCRKYSLL